LTSPTRSTSRSPEHEPGPDGRRLHLDLLGRRQGVNTTTAAVVVLSAFSVAKAPTGGVAFHPSHLRANRHRVHPAVGGFVTTASGEHPIAGAAPDHAARNHQSAPGSDNPKTRGARAQATSARAPETARDAADRIDCCASGVPKSHDGAVMRVGLCSCTGGFPIPVGFGGVASGSAAFPSG
jgi:hypothetical protein